MTTLKQRFAALAAARPDISQADLARATGAKPPSVNAWFSGDTKSMKGETAAKAAALYGCSAIWLATGVGPMYGNKAESSSNVAPAKLGARRVPVITSIQAGMWAEIVDNFQPGDAGDWLLTDIDLSDSAFALDIRGNSMEPEFKDGDRVIIDPEIAPQPGDFVAAKNGEQEATFKKYRPRGMDAKGNMIFELVPLNDDYPTLRSDVQPIRIVGTMVEHRKYRRPR
jgi:SOS-response transcriptional repressor LexA